MKNIRTLIVEDDTRVSELHQKFLEKAGGFETVGIAGTLEEAKEIILILEPELVLLDLFFPDGHGLSFLKEMRSSDIMADVILVTADKDGSTLQDALRFGAFDYIVKPVSFERFRHSLEKYKAFRTGVASKDKIEQTDADSLFLSAIQGENREEDVPKGIDSITLNKVRSVLEKSGRDGICAEKTGKLIGASRITARRYLEYLVSTGALRADVVYGTVGRPERKYFTL